jgi:hypothetical protein
MSDTKITGINIRTAPQAWADGNVALANINFTAGGMEVRGALLIERPDKTCFIAMPKLEKEYAAVRILDPDLKQELTTLAVAKVEALGA